MTPVKWLDKQAKLKHVTLNEADQLVPVANHFAEIARRYEAMEKALYYATLHPEIPFSGFNQKQILIDALAAARAPIGETT